MRTFFTWILLIAVIVVGAYFGSPWWTVWNLERSAKAGDAAAVSRVVDFPAVRASLSPQLTVQLQQALNREQQKPKGILDQLTLFASKLLAPKPVDALVTPEGVTYMIKTAKAPEWTNPFKREKLPPPGEPTLDAMHSWYVADDLDQFHAVLNNKLAPGRAVSLTLLRRGFLSWKVTQIDLVKSAEASPQSASSQSN